MGVQVYFLQHSHPLAARPGNHPKYFFLGFVFKILPFSEMAFLIVRELVGRGGGELMFRLLWGMEGSTAGC